MASFRPSPIMLLYLLGAAVLGIAYYIFGVQLPAVNKTQARLDSAKQQQAALVDTTQRASQSKRSVDTLKDLSADFSAFRLTQETVVATTDALSMTATARGVSLTIDNLTAPSQNQSQMAVSMQGTLQSILEFLRDTESQKIYISFTNFSFTRSEPTAAHPQLSVSATATLSWQ